MSQAQVFIPAPLWTDSLGNWGVWEAKHVPPGVTRSKTKTQLADAIAVAPVDCAPLPAVGPKSLSNYVKANMLEMITAYGKAKAAGQVKMQEPPEKLWPHKCPACGGRTLELFSSVEHEATGTRECPQKEKSKSRYV